MSNIADGPRPKTSEMGCRGRSYANCTNNQISLNLLREISRLKKEVEIGDCLDDFEIIDILGKGAFGVVYKAVSKINRLEYVLKKLSTKNMDQEKSKSIVREVQLLKKLKHPNIITYYNSFIEDNNLFIVMEYARGGDYYKIMKQHFDQRGGYTEKEIWAFAYDMAKVLEYLHANSIIHCDIKPQNIFISADGKLKVGDLGMSKVLAGNVFMENERCGTPLYCAPEVIKKNPFDYQIDIWSLGVILYLMATQNFPFQGDSILAVGFKIIHKSPPPLPNTFSSEFRVFVSRLLEKNPAARLKTSELFKYMPKAVIWQNKTDTKEDSINLIDQTAINNKPEPNLVAFPPAPIQSTTAYPHNFKTSHATSNLGSGRQDLQSPPMINIRDFKTRIIPNYTKKENNDNNSALSPKKVVRQPLPKKDSQDQQDEIQTPANNNEVFRSKDIQNSSRETPSQQNDKTPRENVTKEEDNNDPVTPFALGNGRLGSMDQSNFEMKARGCRTTYGTFGNGWLKKQMSMSKEDGSKITSATTTIDNSKEKEMLIVKGGVVMKNCPINKKHVTVSNFRDMLSAKGTDNTLEGNNKEGLIYNENMVQNSHKMSIPWPEAWPPLPGNEPLQAGDPPRASTSIPGKRPYPKFSTIQRIANTMTSNMIELPQQKKGNEILQPDNYPKQIQSFIPNTLKGFPAIIPKTLTSTNFFKSSTNYGWGKGTVGTTSQNGKRFATIKDLN